MSDQQKLELLRIISKDASVDKSVDVSFKTLVEAMDLSKEQLKKLLLELEKERFITEYPMENNDYLIVTVHQKGFDAIQDESFI